ncbi:hypothetical protein [Ramlibacter humi]|uniref:Uncharacterized protein n=1 Tax=Ramlibacter humi TaxID=2530451 RepID=A0A4Z0C7T1_9BURK|nr:hypothetical protein [Ramlibacter humi]TFZ07737.1 hypothetical protein EZ216_00805 [Ramlibacter humi]
MTTRLVLGDHATQAGDLVLRVGVAEVAALFRRDPPTAGQIEAGIDVVEEAIGAPAAKFAGATLQGEGAQLAAIARAAGVDASREPLTADAVERVFTRLAMAAGGSLPSADALPPGPDFAATLLLLRELMHHLQIGAVKLEPPHSFPPP